MHDSKQICGHWRKIISHLQENPYLIKSFIVFRLIKKTFSALGRPFSWTGKIIDKISKKAAFVLSPFLKKYDGEIETCFSLLISTLLGAAMTVGLSLYSQHTTNWATAHIDKLNDEALSIKCYIASLTILLFLSASVSIYLRNCSPNERFIYLLQKEEDGLCRSLLDAATLRDNQTTNIRLTIVSSILVKVLTAKMAASLLGTLLGLEAYLALFRKISSMPLLLATIALVIFTVVILTIMRMWIHRAENEIGF
ncbi:hypothetical protein [Burkholderia territorii]|uniref:hypothetical protein n=1 Tax=Burkholderia territorii TaxID=1503055 RepID=UPI000AAAFF54|nr:hypothetical protein [Burkholderia territorii]